MAAKKPKQNKPDPSFDPSKPIKKNINQERFCYLYSAGNNQDTFGNGMRSYSIAFGFEEKINKAEEELTKIPYTREVERKEKRSLIQSMNNTCRVNSSKLLTMTNIVARCDYFLSQLYSEDNADKELAYVMSQRKDLNSKTAAIREFNRVRNRVKDKIEGEIIVRWADEDQPNEVKK